MQDERFTARAGCILSGAACGLCALLCGISLVRRDFNASVAVLGVCAGVLYLSGRTRLRRLRAAEAERLAAEQES